MFYQTEAKAQGWRAVAIFDDATFRSSSTSRAFFHASPSGLRRVLYGSSRRRRTRTRRVDSDCHAGRAPDAGHWLHQTNLKMPLDHQARQGGVI